jgi:hypothetical protein
MPACTYRGRRAASIENPQLRITVLIEGGHIAEVLDKRTGINPLWTPAWPSIEPSSFDAAKHAHYGGAADGRLLAGIMGHNVCLDIFGGPSAEEAAAGLSAHGEGSVVPYAISMNGAVLEAHAELPHAGLTFARRLELRRNIVGVVETVTNMSACDRPVGWTQHVTLGAPFLKAGVTEFRASATRSKVIDGPFGPADYLAAGATFDWPHAPGRDGGHVDLRRYTDAPASSAYTAHLMDPSRDEAFFVAFDPETELAFGYEWRQADFPWMGIWEENRSRPASPWNNREITRGMEFGVSPFPETRRDMIARGPLFGTPTFRWIPARSQVSTSYRIIATHAAHVPESPFHNAKRLAV